MARVFLVVVLGLLCSLSPASSIRTKPSDSGNEKSLPEVDARSSSSTDQAVTRLHTLAEGNCGRMSVLGGLKIEETVKVSLNGWAEDDEDLVITLVTDVTPAVAKLREADSKQAMASQQRGGHGSAGQQPEIFDDTQLQEKAAVPLVGIRIPGTKSGNQAAALLYRSDVNKPTEFPLDTPASHHSAIMVFFSQSTNTEMRVAVYTWVPKKSGANNTEGSWHSTYVDVGSGPLSTDFQLTVNDCSPRFLRVFASSSTTFVTVKDKNCEVVDPQLVKISPSATQALGSSSTNQPAVSAGTTGSSAGSDEA
ncbi:hypothetical protein ACSSS7_006277 [Eimeria intestinalis]